jgi:ABC-type spermidine/putrescine transport systems, ATPase components
MSGGRDPHPGRHRAAGAAERQGSSLAGRQSGVIAVRPEAISLGAAEGLDYRFAGRVQNKIYLGDQTEFSIATAELGDILVRAANSSHPWRAAWRPGTRPCWAGGGAAGWRSSTAEIQEPRQT